MHNCLEPKPTDDDYTRHFPTLIQQLGTQGWSVTSGFLSPHLTADLRNAMLNEWQAGAFRHAGIGRGSSFEINPTIRNDRVNWLGPDHAQGPFGEYLASMEALRQALNHSLYLGLIEYEAHLAVYPPGAAYKKHLDQFRGIGLRTVTTTLYLNDHWQSSDGGQLRLYLDDAEPQRCIDVLPEASTLVTFLSARYLHEVLPSVRDRLSITGWFKVRDLGPARLGE